MGDASARVLVVCGTGTVCSALVMATLEEHIGAQGLEGAVELDCCSGDEVQLRARDFDLIVTTVEIPADLGKPVINGYTLLYGDDPEVLAAFDEAVRNLGTRA